MKQPTARQRQALAAAAMNIQKQVDRAQAAIQDDPMFGPIWSALNRIASDAQMIESTVETLPEMPSVKGAVSRTELYPMIDKRLSTLRELAPMRLGRFRIEHKAGTEPSWHVTEHLPHSNALVYRGGFMLPDDAIVAVLERDSALRLDDLREEPRA